MQAALPYIDDFLPVHNLASLEDLARRLTDVDGRRGIRARRTAIERRGRTLINAENAEPR
jgi:hypothetical protein